MSTAPGIRRTAGVPEGRLRVQMMSAGAALCDLLEDVQRRFIPYGPCGPT